ncbi:MAG: amidohydrolase family protein [Longimicrobiales bacterium]
MACFRPTYCMLVLLVSFSASCASAPGGRTRASATGAGTLALIGATVIDGTGAPPLRDGVIVIEAGRITAVGTRDQVAVPGHATRRNVSGLTVLPGLIDSHVHLALSMVAPGAHESAVDALLVVLLDQGVTSVRDVGGPYPWMIELARAIESGQRAGPRIFAAGPTITAPAGHPAGTLLKGSAEAIELGTRQLRAPGEARPVVRELAEGGVSLIKVIFDGGSQRSPLGLLPRLDTTTLRAVVSEARAAGLPVTVHWSNVSELAHVVAARPTQLEHPGVTPIPDALIEQIAQSGIAVDPTLVVYSTILPPNIFSSGPLSNVRRLAARGVVITAGTDAPLGGLRPGESLHRELELLVQAGLTPVQAVQAATGNAARFLGRNADVGTIAVGKRADLLFVSGDPATSITDIRNVRLVIQNGRVVRQK